MRFDKTLMSILFALAVSLIAPLSASASKAKFERTKPHVNVGTLPAQTPRILLYNPADTPPCTVFATLTATDIELEEVILMVENIELEGRQSVAIPIPALPYEEERREVKVEIDQDENPPSCPLISSVVGYDSISEATEYYIDTVGQQRWYKFSVEPDGSVQEADTRSIFVGFAGGNSGQFARVILTPYATVANQENAPCDLAGVLHLQTVPLHNDKGHEIEKQTHPVAFEEMKAFIADIDFTEELGAITNARADVVIWYTFNQPLRVGLCPNLFTISLHTINRDTNKEEGGRHTPFFSNYRPQFYFR